MPGHRLDCFVLLLLAAGAPGTWAADADAIGLAPLRREQPSLTGAGIIVGQSEGEEAPDRWQVNPAAVGLPESLFTWSSASGTATTFPNAVGLESGHANGVGNFFFGAAFGVAPGVQEIRTYQADHYANSVLVLTVPPERIMNDSWIAGVDTALDLTFDNFAAQHDTLFISGMNNAADVPQSPGSCYNGIGVGNSDGFSSIGPTVDGRCKPDLVVAGADATSYTTPLVSGAAALLMQAGARNDGGANTALRATNSVVVKALLLNGAVKQHGWTNSVTRPLHLKWGAGNLNIYNSWLQLRGGRAPFIAANTVPRNDPHPPTGNTNNVATLRGWDFNSISSSVNFDAVAHYYLRLPANGGKFTGVATLVWKRPSGVLPQTTTARNLDLFLYDADTSNLVASSQSTIDNVEHLFLTNLPPGRYDLQVLKRGGIGQNGGENYALAFDFVSPAVRIVPTNNSVIVSWPVNEAGLVLQGTSTFTPLSWQNIAASVFITNAQNTVTLPGTNGMRYFRLFRP